MGVLSIDKARNDEASRPSHPEHEEDPACQSDFEYERDRVEAAAAAAAGLGLVTRDSLEIQKDRGVNDDENHQENANLEELLIPCGKGHVSPTTETEDETSSETSSDCDSREEDEAHETPAGVEPASKLEPAMASSKIAPKKPKRRIHWGQIRVRDYEMSLGDHPCCSYGPPVSLSWDYLSYSPISVDEYEFHRPPRRGLREMQLNYYARVRVLEGAGVSEEEWKRGAKEVGRAKLRRHVTRQIVGHGSLVRVETAVESAARKFKRLLREDHWKSEKGQFATV